MFTIIAFSASIIAVGQQVNASMLAYITRPGITAPGNGYIMDISRGLHVQFADGQETFAGLPLAGKSLLMMRADVTVESQEITVVPFHVRIRYEDGFIERLDFVGVHDTEPAYSTNMRYVAFTAEITTLFIHDTQTEQTHRIDLDIPAQAHLFSPTWLPDNCNILFVVDPQEEPDFLLRYDVCTNTTHTVYSGIEYDVFTPLALSPSGRYVAMGIFGTSYATRELQVLDLDTGDLIFPNRSLNHASSQRTLTWSSDSEQLLFSGRVRGGGDADIYRFAPTTRDLELVYDSTTEDRYPVWSPGGTQLAFTATQQRNNGLANGLFIMDADGTNIRQIHDLDSLLVTAITWLP